MNLQVFKNDNFGEIRTIEENGVVLFCGADVARALGYSNTKDAIIRHCRGVVKRDLTDNLGRQQEAAFIPEPDLYRLIVKSQLPEAEKFEKWVFEEVLPSVRKHGAYMTPEKLKEAILNPDTMIKLCTALKDEQDKRKALEAVNSTLAVQNEIYRPKAEYFDELVERNLLTNFRDTAKQLQISPKKFVGYLIEHKYVYRDKKGKLAPYRQYADKGLFEVKECINEKTEWSGTQTLITPKGRETFRLLYLGTSA